MLGYRYWEFICRLKNYYNSTKNTIGKSHKELVGRIDWFNTYFSLFNDNKYLQKQPLPELKRGDIVLVELGFNIGMEFGGRHYCIVLRDSSVHNQRALILPITSQKPSDYEKHKELYVEFLSIRHLNSSKDRFSPTKHKRWCNILNVKSISKARIVYPNGRNLPSPAKRIQADKMSEISSKIVKQIALREDLLETNKKYKKLLKEYEKLKESLKENV